MRYKGFDMINLLHKNIKGGVKGTLAGLFIVCLLFGLSIRTGAEHDFSQHCLAIITDHYYLLYFMIPLFLLLCFFVMEDDSEVVILRYKTYFRYFIRKWLSFMVISLVFMAVQLLAIGLSGAGLLPGGCWIIADGTTTQELFTVLSSYFASPALCFTAVSAYMFAGLCITAMISMWIGHFLSKSWAIKSMLFLYLLSVMSMRIGFIRDLPITVFNYFIILHHNLSGSYRLIITAVTSVILIFLMLWTVKKCWNHQLLLVKRKVKGITPYYCRELISIKNVTILGAVVILMVVWKFLQSIGDIDSGEWIFKLFAGHGTGSFRMLNFIEMLLLNGTPVYLIAVFVEKMTTGHSALITIRLKKRRDILGGILTSVLLFVLLYGVFLVVFPIIGLSAMGYAINSGTLTLLGLSVSIKLLDITAQILFITVIYCLTGQITIGFISLMAANLLCITSSRAAIFLPFGLSSLSRINLPQLGVEGIASPYAALILLTAVVLFIGWLHTAGYKRLPKN